MTKERRKGDRRQDDRRKKQIPVDVDRRKGERRSGVERRRKQYQRDMSFGYSAESRSILIEAAKGTIRLVPVD